MKRINNITVIVTALLFVMSGCGDKFLEKEPSQELSSDQIAAAAAQDPSLLNGSIAGVYSTMYGSVSPSDDNFGQKAWDIYSDMLCSDMLLAASVYGWYANLCRLTSTTNYASREAGQPWNYYYKIVRGANSVIDALGGTDVDIPNDNSTNKEKRHIMGQAKAMRAYAYFYLANLYATEYGDGSARILPIYTSAELPNQPTSTTADVYNLIISDLTTAIDYLADYTRTSGEQVDQWVAKGLLAYAYATRGGTSDIQQVISLTDDILTNSGYPMATASALVAQFNPATDNSQDPSLDDERPMLNHGVAGFNTLATSPNWMWGIDLTTTNYGYNLYGWWGVIDLFTYSYAWAGDPKTISNDLYNAIRNDDIRKNQFTTLLWDDPNHYWPINKFCSSFRTKFDDPDEEGLQYMITDDYVYMRIEEFYLLSAEAKAKSGDDAGAKTVLKQLLQNRIADLSYIDALTGQALQNEIYLQTRIELWGEGKSYLAMKRNKATVTRPSTDIFLPGESWAYNDPKLTFLIPQSEVLGNAVLNK